MPSACSASCPLASAYDAGLTCRLQGVSPRGAPEVSSERRASNNMEIRP